MSMNLTNYEATPIFRVSDLVCREAERHGVSVASSEIVGLMPQKALDDSAEYYLRLENFSGGQILENRLSEKLSPEQGIDEFLASVAAREPVPGGGSVAAVGAQLAYAALKGAHYNVLVNVPGLRDTVFAENSRAESLDLVRKGRQILQQVDRLMEAS